MFFPEDGHWTVVNFCGWLTSAFITHVWGFTKQGQIQPVSLGG